MALLFLIVALLAKGYWNAMHDPIIRTATVAVADWPEGTPPITLLLISDIHVAGPDMPPERLVRLVRQFNGLRPDLVLIGGDLVSERRASTHHYTPEEIV
ncbi:MAG: metallophosphoesterase, partial [Sphingopyxis sp.]